MTTVAFDSERPIIFQPKKKGILDDRVPGSNTTKKPAIGLEFVIFELTIK